MKGLQFALRTMTRRRGAPEWSAPAELYWLCYSPEHITRPHRLRQGVGAPGLLVGAVEVIQKRMERFHIHLRGAAVAPLVAHHSQGVPIDKKKGEASAKGLRLIHMLCPVWRAYYKHLLRDGQRRVWRSRTTLGRAT